MARNVVVAQSGGPSPVINSTLRGIVEGCQSYPVLLAASMARGTASKAC